MSRKRSVNVSEMTTEQVDGLSEQIGVKITAKLKKPLEDIQKFLDVYGLELELGYNVKIKESQQTEE